MGASQNRARDAADQVYRYICDYLVRHGQPPGLEEIATHFERTQQWALNRFQNLHRRGLVSGFGRNATVCDQKIYTDAKRWLIIYQAKDETEILEDILARLEALRSASDLKEVS